MWVKSALVPKGSLSCGWVEGSVGAQPVHVHSQAPAGLLAPVPVGLPGSLEARHWAAVLELSSSSELSSCTLRVPQDPAHAQPAVQRVPAGA